MGARKDMVISVKVKNKITTSGIRKCMIISAQVKNHIWIFVNALIENPTFDSQTKENMTLQSKSFGSKCSLSEKFIKSVGFYHYLLKLHMKHLYLWLQFETSSVIRPF